jgi:hypothetical protein
MTTTASTRQVLHRARPERSESGAAATAEYDDPVFFRRYQAMRERGGGLNEDRAPTLLIIAAGRRFSCSARRSRPPCRRPTDRGSATGCPVKSFADWRKYRCTANVKAVLGPSARDAG